jgi:hypothetical protein
MVDYRVNRVDGPVAARRPVLLFNAFALHGVRLRCGMFLRLCESLEMKMPRRNPAVIPWTMVLLWPPEATLVPLPRIYSGVTQAKASP